MKTLLLKAMSPVFFDNDQAGKKGTEKMINSNISWKSMALPEGGSTKDISDMVLAEGFEKAREWVKSTLETTRM